VQLQAVRITVFIWLTFALSFLILASVSIVGIFRVGIFHTNKDTNLLWFTMLYRGQ